MLIITRPLLKPKHSDHLAQIRSGGENDTQCAFEGVRHEDVDLFLSSKKRNELGEYGCN